jgi:hypothetical protein
MFKRVRATLQEEVCRWRLRSRVTRGGRKGPKLFLALQISGGLSASRPATQRQARAGPLSPGLSMISHSHPDEAAFCRPDAGSGLVVSQPQAAHALHSKHHDGRHVSRRLISPSAKTAQSLPGDCWSLLNLFEDVLLYLLLLSPGTKFVAFRVHFQSRVMKALMGYSTPSDWFSHTALWAPAAVASATH